jgi:hypothetical protein
VSKHRVWLLLVCVALVSTARAQTGPPAIVLPDLLAVELPAGRHDLGPNDPPLRDLLAAARSGTLKVTADLATPVSAGPVKVTWTAWDASGKPVGSRSAVVYVLPTGMTPVGTSGDENATGGNNATRIVRDAAGHVHMMWADSGGPSGRTGPMYRRAVVAADGTVQLETPPINVAEGGPSEWNCYPALTLAGDAVQMIWQGGGTVRTRRLSLGSAGQILGPIYDTGAKSEGRDIGPAIVADPRGLDLVTPSGIYGFSADGGRTWRTDALPLPQGQRIKTVSLAPNENGGVDIAFSSIARDRTSDSNDVGAGGWWQLRTVRRTDDGHWIGASDVLAAFPGWSAPPANEDALVDWVRIAADADGGLHAVWHGTAQSRIYGHDSAFYAWRDIAGVWHPPVQLVAPDPARGVKFSFAPSIAVDGDRALALVFYDVYAGSTWVGFDSAIAVMHRGRTEGRPVPVTQFAQAAAAAGHPELALGSRFPAVAPTVRRTPDGHIWLDVLESLRPMFPGAVGYLIVYHRVDVTAALQQ